MHTKIHFRMPAEWETQVATCLSWPHNVETWPLNLQQAQAEFVGFAEAIAENQPVFLMTPANQLSLARSRFHSDAVCMVPLETNDAWARDYAPTFVKDLKRGELVAIDWYYNAWGGKYPPFEADQQVAKQVADHLNVRHLAAGLCLEGGAIEINAQGVLLTTESCALNPNRNPGYSKQEVESLLKQRLGCTRIVWLPGDSQGQQALGGDDTDGHIDQLARFVDDQTIVHAWVEASDPRHAALAANVRALAKQLPAVQLVPLWLPPPLEFLDRQIPASYCNFLITNEKVIVPQFGMPQEDAAAVEVLASLFGSRKTVPLASRNLAVGLGSFHCLAQQQPG